MRKLTGIFLFQLESNRSTHQHCLSSSLKPSGISSGMGRRRLALPTPHIIAVESTSL